MVEDVIGDRLGGAGYGEDPVHRTAFKRWAPVAGQFLPHRSRCVWGVTGVSAAAAQAAALRFMTVRRYVQPDGLLGKAHSENLAQHHWRFAEPNLAPQPLGMQGPRSAERQGAYRDSDNKC